MGSGNGAAFRTANYPVPAVALEGFLPKVGRWDWVEKDDDTQWYQHDSPNPTTGIANLSFTLSASGKVQINIHDITGKLMETVEPGYLDAGRNTVTLDFTDKPNAQYIISVISENNVMTGKICKN